MANAAFDEAGDVMYALSSIESSQEEPSPGTEIGDASVEQVGSESALPTQLIRERARSRQMPRRAIPLMVTGLPTSEELQMEKEPIRVRETSFLFWHWVVVPPNVYVVRTRSGHKKPITIGLGLSFRFRPSTDSYLVVPAAMQTIGIVANCITKEKQGVNILAYVQWQIADFSIAYQKLDFSDLRDPLGIVNAQLREQAEAAIKDKIATMSVEEVLTDKAPIIEELTARLKIVAEGRIENDAEATEGLGIKIVTVQLKEAMVSSQELWENLQAPFRHEKQLAAHMSRLSMQEQIRKRELEAHQFSETSEAETATAIELAKQGKQTESYQARLNAEGQRYQMEVGATLAKLDEETRLNEAQLIAQQAAYKRQTTLKKLEADLNLISQQLADSLEEAKQNASLERTEAESRVRQAIMKSEAEVNRLQQEIRNLANKQDLTARLIEQLPALATSLPQIDELRILQTGNTSGFDALASFLLNIHELGKSMGLANFLPGNERAAEDSE
ncbi:MAG: SPFH/Band 7/PHB domain protein [Anaerolineae bacterium]|nr:SPFH/Band 7/PHB domain protein [Anaerolineae bacterium]